jgi:hypothetical protein
LGLWILVRTIVLFEFALPDGRYISGDAGLFAGWGRQLASGAEVTTSAWQYPPGFALLIAGVAALGGGATVLLSINLLCDLLILYMVRGTPGAILWALAPFAMGLMMLTHLDTIAAALAVAALIAGPRSPALRGMLFGLGASLKLWPGALVGAAPRGTVARACLAAGAAYGLTAVLARVLLGPDRFGRNVQGRGLQIESLAAWPFMVARSLGADVDLVFRSGANEIASPVADSIATILLPLSVALIAALWFWAWRTRAGELSAGVPLAMLCLVTLLATSRVLSPQFNAWVLALLALGMAVGNVPRVVLISGVTTSALAHLLYPFAYDDYLSGGLLGLSIQTLRLAALLAMGVALLRMLTSTVVKQAGGTPAAKAARAD